MQNSTFIGLDVYKATISMAIAQGERGGEVRHWGPRPRAGRTSNVDSMEKRMRRPRPIDIFLAGVG